MELIKQDYQRGAGMLAREELPDRSGYELQVTKNGNTETWKGKVNFFGILEMLEGTCFLQLRFISREHPTMYLNIVLPRNNALAEGIYTFRLVPYEESGDLEESVTEFYLPNPNNEEGIPDQARSGHTHIRLDQGGYAIAGAIEAKISGSQRKSCSLKGTFWLEEWSRGETPLLCTTNFT